MMTSLAEGGPSPHTGPSASLRGHSWQSGPGLDTRELLRGNKFMSLRRRVVSFNRISIERIIPRISLMKDQQSSFKPSPEAVVLFTGFDKLFVV
jgi:hypothetical protein